MQHLTTVQGSFHGRVVAARLGAEGVLVELRGLFEGPYPLPGPVDVWVPTDQLEVAREILLADAVEDAFSTFEKEDAPGAEVATPAAGQQSRNQPSRLIVFVALGIVLMLVLVGISVVASVY